MALSGSFNKLMSRISTSTQIKTSKLRETNLVDNDKELTADSVGPARPPSPFIVLLSEGDEEFSFDEPENAGDMELKNLSSETNDESIFIDDDEDEDDNKDFDKLVDDHPVANSDFSVEQEAVVSSTIEHPEELEDVDENCVHEEISSVNDTSEIDLEEDDSDQDISDDIDLPHNDSNSRWIFTILSLSFDILLLYNCSAQCTLFFQGAH